MQLKERLYLIEDRSKAVKESDRRGRHLLGKKGGTITEEEAEFYGIVDGYLKDGASVADQVVTPLKKKRKSRAKSKAKTVEPKEDEPKEGETMKLKEEDKKNNQIIPPEATRLNGLSGGLSVDKLKASKK